MGSSYCDEGESKRETHVSTWLLHPDFRFLSDFFQLEVYSPGSGIKLSVTSNQRAIQVYVRSRFVVVVLGSLISSLFFPSLSLQTCGGQHGTIPVKATQGGAGFVEQYSCMVIEMEDVIDGEQLTTRLRSKSPFLSDSTFPSTLLQPSTTPIGELISGILPPDHLTSTLATSSLPCKNEPLSLSHLHDPLCNRTLPQSSSETREILSLISSRTTLG